MRFKPLRVVWLVYLSLILTLGAAGKCMAVSIQLDKNSAKPGDCINMSGTTTSGDWVSLRAIDGTGSILYFNIVKADNSGQYKDAFIVPGTCEGTLRVIAGQGNDGATASVTAINNPTSTGGSAAGGSGESSSIKSENNLIIPAEPKPESKIPFDIAGHWARESIIKLIQAGVVTGYPDGSFQADRTISRSEFTVMVVKALRLPNTAKVVFADCREHWARESIATAAANHLVSGYDQNTFGPDDKITREQAAVIVSRAAQLTTADDPPQFTDSSQISPWAKADISAAAINGIINGYPDGSFRPQANLTRAEAVSMIVYLIK